MQLTIKIKIKKIFFLTLLPLTLLTLLIVGLSHNVSVYAATALPTLPTSISTSTSIRIVALAPHLAQLAISAGVGQHLVGVSEYTPAAYAGQLPMVGNAFAINWDKIAELKPTLVLIWGSGTPIAIKTRLKALHLATFESEPATLADIVQEAKRLAMQVGEPLNNAHLHDLDAQLKQLEQLTASLTKINQPTMTAFHPIWHRPLMTINGQHVISDALRQCGLRNVFAKAKGLSPTVSLAQVLREQPQLLIVAATPSDTKDKALAAWQPILKAFPAENRPTVIRVNGEKFHQPGPSLIEETLLLCQAVQTIKTTKKPT